jgi:hypothetical protein
LIAGISTPTFLSRKFSEAKQAGPVPDQPPIPELSHQQQDIADFETKKHDLPLDSNIIRADLESAEGHDAPSGGLPNEPAPSTQQPSERASSAQSCEEENADETALDTFEDLTIEETQSSASSLYSRDSSLIYSSDGASIYSSASSIYSSRASIYSFEENELKEIDRYTRTGSSELIAKEAEAGPNSRFPGGLQFQQRARTVAVRRHEPQDAAARERSSLAKKAALFKNSRLSPQLPSFSASLPTWSIVCRAAHASQDCYDSQSLARQGTYTPADTSKDIKAMIIDDQLIDDSRLVIVSIRGTQCQSLADWAVNKAANPAKPVGFLDDEENACHAGFLQVAKAMVNQV